MKQHGASDVLIDGEVIESDPPRKLVQTWRALWDPEVVAEGFRRVTWEIEPGQGGVTTLDVDARAAGCAEDRRAGVGPDQAGGRRLELHPERPEDTARDRQVVRGLVRGVES